MSQQVIMQSDAPIRSRPTLVRFLLQFTPPSRSTMIPEKQATQSNNKTKTKKFRYPPSSFALKRERTFFAILHFAATTRRVKNKLISNKRWRTKVLCENETFSGKVEEQVKWLQVKLILILLLIARCLPCFAMWSSTLKLRRWMWDQDRERDR